jgi:hypothetical protein
MHGFYSGEGEMLFAPLTNLERVGNPWVKLHSNKPVVVFSVKVNCNQKSRRIEEILANRRKNMLSFADSAANEIKFDLQLVSKAPFDELKFKKQCDDIMAKTVEWFNLNEDKSFKSALEYVLEPTRKYEAIQEFVVQVLAV